MEVRVFEFPVPVNDNLGDIELKYCNLLNKYRNGRISPEEKDWMDWANNILITTKAGGVNR